MENRISLENFTEKNIYSLGKDFQGDSQDGTRLSLTNYYMEKTVVPSGSFILR